MKVVFLVGGRGTRLGLTDRPKPMVEFLGIPLLERSLKVVVDQGYLDIIFLSGYKADFIKQYFGDGSRFGAKITHVIDESPLGTAGSFCVSKMLLDEPFFVIYGDVLFDIDLFKFQMFAEAKGGVGSLLVHPNDHPHDSDLLEVEHLGSRIIKIHSKPHNLSRSANIVNAAIYYLTPQALDYIEINGPSDWGKDIFPKIIASGGELHAYRSTEYVKDIGTPERMDKAAADFESGLVQQRNYSHFQKAVFLDRDGVINEEIDGVFAPEDFILYNEAAEAIRALNQSGYLVVVITNQPSIAKGFMSFDDLNEVHQEMETQLSRYGAMLDDIFFCPHHPERGFVGEISTLKKRCSCRKPDIALLEKAKRRHNIDFSQSFMVGDRESDIDAAKAAGIRSILVGSTINDKDKALLGQEVVIKKNLSTAVNYILNN